MLSRSRSTQDHHLNKLGRPHIPDATYQVPRSSAFWFWRRRFLKGFYHIWAWQPSWSCDQDHLNKLSFPHPKESPYEIWVQLAQWFQRRRCLKMMTDGRRSHWYTNSSPRSLRLRWAKNLTENSLTKWRSRPNWQFVLSSADKWMRSVCERVLLHLDIFAYSAGHCKVKVSNLWSQRSIFCYKTLVHKTHFVIDLYTAYKKLCFRIMIIDLYVVCNLFILTANFSLTASLII